MEAASGRTPHGSPSATENRLMTDRGLISFRNFTALSLAKSWFCNFELEDHSKQQ